MGALGVARRGRAFGLGWLLAAASLPCAAQTQGIYACTDAKGNRLTADRPIAACSDRPQHELNPSGTVRREVAPVPTAEERVQQEAREQAQAEERRRAEEARRRDRALVTRYPSAESHDRERQLVLTQIDEAIRSARRRIAELGKQRATVNAEMEFYVSNPARAPQTLRRQLTDIEASTESQQRFIAEQEAEKLRVHRRFDSERARLEQLWARAAPTL